jgi:hypothetical protein
MTLAGSLQKAEKKSALGKRDFIGIACEYWWATLCFKMNMGNC